MRTIELTGRVAWLWDKPCSSKLCDAVGRGVALNGVIKSASTGGGLDVGGCHRVVFYARWLFETCRNLGN